MKIKTGIQPSQVRGYTLMEMLLVLGIIGLLLGLGVYSMTGVLGDADEGKAKADIKNWRGNLKNSGFLPEERAWLDRLFGPVGWVDAFRVVNQDPDEYTWWSNRGQAWAKNVGWRIDYQVVTPGLRARILGARIYRDKRFSDHAPLIVDYDDDR